MSYNEAKQSIFEAKNICIIPSQTFEPESLSSALALFYTLKELGKNVNLIVDKVPESLDFLIPSLDFISYPKNFVVSIPKNKADITQVYYEKNEDALKIHLTVDKGMIKKEDVHFYYQEPKPDLIITLGVQNIQQQLMGKLDSFGFLLDTPIVNLDTAPENVRFGKINIIEETSLAQITTHIIASLNEQGIKKPAAQALLSSLILHHENFKSEKTTPEVLKLSADFMEKGANYQEIVAHLFKPHEKQSQFLTDIFKNLDTGHPSLFISLINSTDFETFSESEARFAVEKIESLNLQKDMLALWQGSVHNPSVKGFLYSKNQDTIKKIADFQHVSAKHNWVFIDTAEPIIGLVKDTIIKLLS